MPTGGTVTTGASPRLRQLGRLVKDRVLDPLHDQLGDSVAPAQRHRYGTIMVDQADLDLTPVSGIHRSGRVDHAQSRFDRQTRPRVHEPGTAFGKSDRDARTDERPFSRPQLEVGGRDQIRTGITGSGVGRDRNLGVEAGQQNLDARHGNIRHGPRDYPEHVSESAEAASPTPEAPGQAKTIFRERLYASWWTWPLPVVAAVLLAAEVHMGHPGVRAWLPYLVLVPLAIGVPLMLGRTKIEITDGELWVGDAHLPLRFIEDAEVVPSTEKRRALGADLDPAAFVVHRPWMSSSVRVWLDDDNDPTPYWVISTRHPHKLAELLRTTNKPD